MTMYSLHIWSQFPASASNKEGIFDNVPNFIELFGIFSLFFPNLLWGNDWVYPLARCLVKNFIGIVATVSE